jgi:hypothetical protein
MIKCDKISLFALLSLFLIQSAMAMQEEKQLSFTHRLTNLTKSLFWTPQPKLSDLYTIKSAQDQGPVNKPQEDRIVMGHLVRPKKDQKIIMNTYGYYGIFDGHGSALLFPKSKKALGPLEGLIEYAENKNNPHDSCALIKGDYAAQKIGTNVLYYIHSNLHGWRSWINTFNLLLSNKKVDFPVVGITKGIELAQKNGYNKLKILTILVPHQLSIILMIRQEPLMTILEQPAL